MTLPIFGRLHDVLFAIYGSLLFVWFEESKPFAWPTRYLYFWHRRAVSPSRIDFFLFYAEIFLILAGVTFLVLRLIRLFPFGQISLRSVGGVVALAGFPLACLNRENVLPLSIALIATGVCYLLWVRRGRLGSAPVAVVLFLYYGFCSLVGRSWPTEGWQLSDYAWFLYPTIGFCYTLLWADYFRKTDSRRPVTSQDSLLAAKP